jgi:hypothetical protein
MPISVQSMTVDVFVPMLKNLANLLGKAEAYAVAKKLDAGVLEGARLAPDMFALTRQVQLSCDFAKNSTARLAGVEPPRFEDNETTLAELRERIAKTVAYLQSIDAARLQGAETRHISAPLRNRTLELDGLPFIQKWALPNFFFHVTTAYDLLRHNGVELGKQDYLGGV